MERGRKEWRGEGRSGERGGKVWRGRVGVERGGG